MNNAAGLKDVLLNDLEQVVKYLLPNGKQVSNEWKVGSVGGEEGESLGINISSGAKRGIWSDFATGETGDILSLWQKCKGLTFVEVLKDAGEYVGYEYEPVKKVKPQKNYKKPARPKVSNLSVKTIKWFAGRGIKTEILKKMKVAEEKGNIAFPYLSPTGELERVKYRSLKDKKIWSSKDSMPCLMGWQAISDNDRYVVICEGEIDLLTYAQAGVPCLSVPFGGGSGEKQAWIEFEFDRLARFETIYLSFDNDEAGKQGETECLNRLGRERCKVIELPYKDANEVLMSGITFDFHQAVKDAKNIDPEELKQLADYYDEAMEIFYPENDKALGLVLPWSKTYDTVRLRGGEVTLWAGVNSHGKSVLLSNIIVDLVSQQEKTCIASMEMTPPRQLEKMLRQVCGVKTPSPEYAMQAREFIRDRVWVFNIVGRAKGDRILDVFDYAYKKYGIKTFVIDSLAKCGFRDDDYPAQKEYVDILTEFAKERDIHIHLVMHMRKTDSELKMGGKFDLKGAGGIADMGDNIFIVYRNKPKEIAIKSSDQEKIDKFKDKPDAYVKCEKQRITGEEPLIPLWFDKKSCVFRQYDNEPPKKYLF